MKYTNQLNGLPVKGLYYEELFGNPFPGIDKITPAQEQAFRAKSIERCWKRIYSKVKTTKPGCIIWITCNNVTSKDVAGSDMFRQTDWLMNEAGDTASTNAMKKNVGEHTKLITCLANWNKQDPRIVVPEAIKSNVALYGFVKPMVCYTMPPVDYFLSHPIDSLKGDELNIAVLARAFKGLSLDYIKNQIKK